MRRKKHFGSFLGFLLAAVLTVGCAGGSEPATDGTGTPAADEENSPDGSGPATDGTDTPAANEENSSDGSSDAVSDSVSGAASVPVSEAGAAEITGKQLYLGEYTRLLLKDSVPVWEYQNKVLYADAYDGVVYILEEYRSGEGEDMSRQFFLTTYGRGATELSWEPFALDFPEKGQWFIGSMALPEEGKLSFWVYEYGSGGMDDVSEFLAVTDLKGNLLSLTESIPEEEEYPWRIGTLVVRGADGSMAISRKEQERNYQTVFYSYDSETGRREEIGVSVEVPHVCAIYPEGNMLYYVDGARHLYQWDDREKKLTDMMDHGADCCGEGAGSDARLGGGHVDSGGKGRVAGSCGADSGGDHGAAVSMRCSGRNSEWQDVWADDRIYDRYVAHRGCHMVWGFLDAGGISGTTGGVSVGVAHRRGLYVY